MTAPAKPNQRERILDTALRLMSEHGSAKTSMRHLARECGLNVAAIYHYFESKDALLAAVIDERQYGARLADVPEIPPGLTPADRLALVYRTVWEGALAEEPIWRLLLGEGLRREPAVLDVGQSLLDVIRPGLAAWIEVVLPEAPASPSVVTDLILGQLFAGFVRHIFDPALDVDDIERDAAGALVAALFARAPL